MYKSNNLNAFHSDALHVTFLCSIYTLFCKLSLFTLYVQDQDLRCIKEHYILN